MEPITSTPLIFLPNLLLSLSNIPIIWYGPSGLCEDLISASASSDAPISSTFILSLILLIGANVLSLINL